MSPVVGDMPAWPEPAGEYHRRVPEPFHIAIVIKGPDERFRRPSAKLHTIAVRRPRFPILPPMVRGACSGTCKRILVRLRNLTMGQGQGRGYMGNGLKRRRGRRHGRRSSGMQSRREAAKRRAGRTEPA